MDSETGERYMRATQELRQALTASEARVKLLEDALRNLLPLEIPNFDTEMYKVNKSAIAAARSALGDVTATSLDTKARGDGK